MILDFPPFHKSKADSVPCVLGITDHPTHAHLLISLQMASRRPLHRRARSRATWSRPMPLRNPRPKKKQPRNKARDNAAHLDDAGKEPQNPRSQKWVWSINCIKCFQTWPELKRHLVTGADRKPRNLYVPESKCFKSKATSDFVLLCILQNDTEKSASEPGTPPQTSKAADLKSTSKSPRSSPKSSPKASKSPEVRCSNFHFVYLNVENVCVVYDHRPNKCLCCVDPIYLVCFSQEAAATTDPEQTVWHGNEGHVTLGKRWDLAPMWRNPGSGRVGDIGV